MDTTTSGSGRGGRPERVHARIARHGRGARACDHAPTHERRRAPACAPGDPNPTSQVEPAPDTELAFAELVHDHIPSMVRRARRLLGSEDLAWDAVQESLLSLWQAAEPPAEARPWLLRTVVHRCLHIRRTLHRRWRHVAQAGQLAAAVVTAHNPARELERDTVRHALRCAVSRLSFAQRRAFVLREVEGLDYRDIASRLGVPIGTVRSRLARARSALRHALDGAGRVG
jgi:RNA polymerase sigma-70 factor, ECF subfamily